MDYASYQTRTHPTADQGFNTFSAKPEELRQVENKEHVIMLEIKY